MDARNENSNLTEALLLMFIAMEECVGLVNNSIWLVFIGWYKRGVINNQSLISAHDSNSASNSDGNPNFNSTE